MSTQPASSFMQRRAAKSGEKILKTRSSSNFLKIPTQGRERKS